VSIVKSVYPDLHPRVVFPIEPDTFFVKDAAVLEGLVGGEMSKSVVG
jgi:hypothetical protein